jgi:hypothetical protein
MCACINKGAAAIDGETDEHHAFGKKKIDKHKISPRVCA